MSHVAAPSSFVQCRPRMQWGKANLYMLVERTYGSRRVDLRKTYKNMSQQTWLAKQLLRGYHGDWIQEEKFKKHWVPPSLPAISTPPGKTPVPLSSLMFAPLERRLDVFIVRCCYANDREYAKALVVEGRVKVNGELNREPSSKLEPGDLVSVDPAFVTMLRRGREQGIIDRRLKREDDLRKFDVDLKSEVENELEAKQATEAGRSLAQSIPSPPSKPRKTLKTSHPDMVYKYNLPDFAAPFLFIPPYIEPSFQTCSAIYLRHPTAGPGYSEVPSPYDADGEIMRLGWEFYQRSGRKSGLAPDRPSRLAHMRLGS